MKQKLIQLAGMTAGAFLMAVGVYFFKIPNGFSTGGVSGVSTVLGKLIEITWITPAMLILLINVALLILGFILLDFKSMVNTIYGSLLFSALTWIFERVLPLDAPLTDEPFLELVVAIMLTGIGSALLFQCQASSGGTDIVALILKKYTSLDVGKALLLTDFLISCGAFVFGFKIGLFSLLGLFAKAFLVDGVIENINICKYFMIITDKPDDILDYIINHMHHSATVVNGEGAFTHEQKKVIHTICRRGEGAHLKRKVREIDPHAFVVVESTSEIVGRGFRSV